MFNLNLKKNKGLARTCFRGGFTLLEALVATSILMVAVAAPITIAQKGLSSAVYSKNQMIASYLAQDAIEYIKNKRDQAFITTFDNKGNHDWGNLIILTNGGVSCLNGSSCDIDTVANSGAGEISTFSNQTFLKKDTNGFYGHNGTPTNFTREINVKIDPDGDNQNKALITVSVSWGSVESTVTVKTLIFNI